MKKQITKDAVKMLKEDHKKVKELFEQFEDAENQEEKREIAQTACAELKVHSKLEEEIFYPAVREKIEEEEIMAEAKEEHHVADQLISELESSELEETVYNAKFMVLAENVRHHIKEEEGEMFPKVQKADLDLEQLGEQMAERKPQLEEELVTAGIVHSIIN